MDDAMVRAEQRRKSLRNQMRGRERDEAEYSKRMVQRFEKTGQLATSTTQRGVAEYERKLQEERIDLTEDELKQLDTEQRRAREGVRTVPLGPSLSELLRKFEQRADLQIATYVYNCTDCGKEITYHRKAGAGSQQPRCGSCKSAARRATKRKTWHKNREKYTANKNAKKLVGPLDVPFSTETTIVHSPETEAPVVAAPVEATQITTTPSTPSPEQQPMPNFPSAQPIVPGKRRVVWTAH